MAHLPVLSPRLHNTKVTAALSLALVIVTSSATAASIDATDVVRSLYATLLKTMINGPALGPGGRYRTLDPVIRKTFDISFMARLAIGPTWSSLTAAQHQQVTEAFERYVAATYADRFDSYAGEKLEVSGERPVGAGIFVQSRIVKSNGEPVSIDYLLRRDGEGWRIADVYLDGTISELATRRSDFSAILRDRGIDGLTFELNHKADLLSAKIAAAS